ncbi:PREDICTED: uncharacterized protein LOC109170414 [Ipomoea nil]|uniref:uncharacterized protein LOC109170414 n=1 Tax=Ipomoea nil TaxID=35883 RepID=UPI0009009154|nr:PREDICTED: uncharacterized protein LOC109170414 [Ipomoea nil]
MRKLCPNLGNEDGLDTVLEVPVPDEMFDEIGGSGSSNNNSATTQGWRNLRNCIRAAQYADNSLPLSCNEHVLFLLKIVGSALIPFNVQSDHAISMPVRDCSLEASTAKYIVQQYVAATGGNAALNSMNSMYAVGEVKMTTSCMNQSDIFNSTPNLEVGGFVLWQKNPDLWFLELVISGHKISAGSDGKVAWTQSSSNSNVSRGPPRPLRMFFQGLDPRSTANLFLNGACIGEKGVEGEECFVLKLETGAEILDAQTTPNIKVVHHTIWGSFSQRTGLLIQFRDTKLVKMKTGKGDNEFVFWETSMESSLEDYKYVEGVNIAHAGKTAATIYRYGNNRSNRLKIEEVWKLEEIDFNICGLCMESFLPPADIEMGNEHGEQ